MNTVTEAPRTALLDDDACDHYEIVNGVRVETPPMGLFQAMIATLLSTEIALFNRAARLGRVVVEPLIPVNVPDVKRKRRPDVAFFSYERWPIDKPIDEEEDAGDVVPDLAIEVVSRSNSAYEIVTKLGEYFDSAVRMVWVVYPNVKQIHVYESPASSRILIRVAGEFTNFEGRRRSRRRQGSAGLPPVVEDHLSRRTTTARRVTRTRSRRVQRRPSHEHSDRSTRATVDEADARDHYEIVDGVRVQTPPMGYYQARIAIVPSRYIDQFVDDHELGHVVTFGLYCLPRVEPNAQTLTRCRVRVDRTLPFGETADGGGSIDVEPDLAIEVVSPSNSADEIAMKVNEYFLAGVREVWIVYSIVEQVYIYQSSTQIRVLTRGDFLESAAILRGFRFPVARLFIKKEEAKNA